MEKRSSSKSMSKILRFLPKAAQASVSFQNPNFSPARASGSSQKLKSHIYQAFSGPIIPTEAREESEFETQEPTSPKISCMGQIKHRKTICKNRYASSPTELKPVLRSRPEKLSRTLSAGPAAELQKKAAGTKKILGGGRRRYSDDAVNQGKPPLPDRAPCLSQMMRFASSRDTFACYDWTTEGGGGDLYSVEDWGSYSECYDDVAPILMASARAGLVLEPRKEINLWKRRTVAQLKPLQLNIVKAR